MASGTKLLESQLSECEHKARAVCIGVNHLALDTERIQQDELLQKVKKLEQELRDPASKKSGLSQRASDLRSDIKSNSAALRYLETVSQLERSFTVLTENVSETSVQLSSPKSLSESVYVKKDLGGNVQSCWNYVTNLSRLAQVHLRNAAEYHQFHHAVNETEAKLSRRVKMTDPDHARPLEEDINGAHILSNEMRDHLNHFVHLWARTGQLLEESRRVVPVHLRLGGVHNGLSTNTETPSAVMARALLSLAGPNYELAEGEEVRIVSNTEDPHFWKVQTSSGIVEVPSVCLWISDPDLEAVKRAIAAREKCVEAWDLVLDRMRERLRAYYTRVLNRMADDGDIHYSSKNVMQRFLDDVDLYFPPTDPSAMELRRALDRFQDKLVFSERSHRPQDGILLREQDIVSLHSPLLRIRDHESQMRNSNVQAQFIGQHMAHYLREIDADRRRMDDELSRMSSLQRDHQAQLEHLISRVRRWSSRYERGHPRFEAQESGASSSVRSSTRSDVTWPGDGKPSEQLPRIRRDVMDAITQIGVETENTASQTAPLRTPSEVPGYKPYRPLKEALCQIGQVTAALGVQTDDIEFVAPTHSRKLFQAITQTGTVQADAPVQADLIEQQVVTVVEQAPVQRSLPAQVSDAICQVGYVQAQAHTQTDSFLIEDLQAQSKRPIRDAICQIGSVTTSAGIQTADLTRKDTYDVGEQYVSNLMQTPSKSDVICQIGNLMSVQGTQTTTELAAAYPRREPIVDAACQIGVLQSSVGIQASTMKPPANVLDAVCQIGLIQATVGTQSEIPEDKPVIPMLQQDLQQAVYKSTANVETQIGMLYANQFTQFDGQLKPPQTNATCQTQALQPERRTESYNVESQTGVITNNWATQTDDTLYVQFRAPKGRDYFLRSEGDSRPKMHEFALQTLQTSIPKPRSRSYDVLTQVGVAKESQSTQVEPTYKVYDVGSQIGVISESKSCQISDFKVPRSRSYDVELQTGVVTEVSETQTMLEYRVRGRDAQFKSEEQIRLEPVVVQQTLRPAEPKEDFFQQVHLRPERFDAEMQPDLLRKFDVEIQSGTISTAQSTQTDIAFKPSIPVSEASVQFADIKRKEEENKKFQVNILPTPYDVMLESERVISMDLVAPVQQALPEKPKCDVELQSGFVTTTHSTQTDLKFKSVAPVDDASVQHEFRTPRGFDTSMETEQAVLVDLVAPVQQAVRTDDVGIQTVTSLAKYDVEIQSGVVQQQHGVQTDLKMKPAVPLEDVAVQHATVDQKSIENKKFQVNIAPIAYEALLESDQPILVDVVAPVQQAIPTSDSGVQAEVIRSKIDVELQSGTVTTTHQVQTELRMRAVAPTNDVTVQFSPDQPKETENKKFQVELRTIGSDALIESDRVIQMDVVAPVGQAMSKPIMEDQAIQAFTLPAKYDVELQSGIVCKSNEVQTEAAPKAYDSLIESEKMIIADIVAPVQQQRTQTHDVETQAGVFPQKYDVEIQSGLVTTAHSTQTDEVKKPKVQVDDAAVQYELVKPVAENKKFQVDISPRPVDALLESDQPLRVDVVAPVQQIPLEVPKEDQCIQCGFTPTKYDVEMQSGLVTTAHSTQTDEVKKPKIQVDDAAIQYESARPVGENKKFQVNLSPKPVDSLLESDQPLRVDVVAPVQQIRIETEDVGIQAGVSPQRFDVEMQSGTVMDVHETQTETKLKAVVPVDDVSVQHEFVGPRAFDAILESEEVLRVDVLPPVQLAAPEPPKEDVCVQAGVTPQRYDVEMQSGMVMDTHGTQTETKLRAVVPVDDAVVQFEGSKPSVGENKKFQVNIAPKPVDALLESDQPLRVDVVAPIQQIPIEVPKSDAFIQCELKPIRYDVEMQSGHITEVHSTQTDEIRKPVVHAEDASVQHTGVKPTDAVFGSESPVSVDMVAPVQQALPKSTVAVQAFFAPAVTDVEIQSGIVTNEAFVQTKSEEKVSVETVDASLMYDQKALVSKEIQASLRPETFTVAIQSEPALQVDVVAPVQQTRKYTLDNEVQAILQPKKFDVEVQSGMIFASQGQQTDPMVKQTVPTKDTIVQCELAKPRTETNKKLQVCLKPPGLDALLETEQEIKVDILPLPQSAPEIPKHDVETQAGTVLSEHQTQTAPLFTAEDTSVQFGMAKPKFFDCTLGSEFIQSVDIVAPVQQFTPQTPKEDIGLQVGVLPKRYDVELQSGLIMDVRQTQTDPVVKPVIPVDDKSLQYEAKQPVAYDMIMESERPMSVDLVAPVQQIKPEPSRSDDETQTAIETIKYDVEIQSGRLTKVHGSQSDMRASTEDASVQHSREITSPGKNKKFQVTILPTPHDRSLDTGEALMVDVVAPVEAAVIPRTDVGLQAGQKPVGYDVECQFGNITTNSSSQTDPERKVSQIDVSAQCEPVSKLQTSQGVQAVIESRSIDAVVVSERQPSKISKDYQLRTEELLNVELMKPVQAQRDFSELGVQVELKPIRYDVEVQSGTVMDIHSTQTELMLKPVVPVNDSTVQHAEPSTRPGSNKKFQVKLPTPGMDAIIASEEKLQVDIITPVKSEISRNDSEIQVSISPLQYDVIVQAGVLTSSNETQTEAQFKPVRPVDDVTVQHEAAGRFNVETQAGTLTEVAGTQTEWPTVEDDKVQYESLSLSSILNKKLQVQLSPQKINTASQNDDMLATMDATSQTLGDVVDSEVYIKREAVGQDYASKSEDALTVVTVPLEQAAKPQAIGYDVVTQIGPSLQTATTQITKGEFEQPVVDASVFQVSDRTVERESSSLPVPYQPRASQAAQTQTEPMAEPSTTTTVYTTKVLDQSVFYTTSATHSPSTAEAMVQTADQTFVVDVVAPVQSIPTEEHGVCSQCHRRFAPEQLSVTATQTEPEEVKSPECAVTTVSYHEVPASQIVHAPPPSTALVESFSDFTKVFVNKKCQISRLSSSVTKPMSANKKIQTKTSTDSVEPTGEVSKAHVEAEIQAGPLQHNKKLQAVVSKPSDVPEFLPQPVKTDSSSQTTAEYEEVRMIQAAEQQQAPPQTSIDYTMRTLPERRDVTVDSIGAEYVTQILQADIETPREPLVYRTQLITSCSEKVESPKPVETTHVTFSEHPPQPMELHRPTVSDATCEVNLTTFRTEFVDYVNANLQMTVPTTENWVQTEVSGARHSPVQTRHVRIQKGSSCLFSRQQEVSTQVEPTDEEVPVYIRPVQSSFHQEVIDTTECFVSTRYGSGSLTSPPGSVRGSILSTRYMRPGVINWGVQCTPHTLTGVTQTTDLLKYETGSEISGEAVSIKEDVKQAKGVKTMGVQTELEEDYIVKRVVTTIARRPALHSYRHTSPVVRQMRGRGRTPLLSSSLPSHLDEQLIEADDEQTPLTTKKVTTTYLDGEQKIIREELLTEDIRGRARSLDSRLGPHFHLTGQELYEGDVFEGLDEPEIPADAEQCFHNLLTAWSLPYLLSRIRRYGGSMSVDRDLVTSVSGGRPTRLVGAKTQYTSTGSLLLPATGTSRTAETQTTGFVGVTRPPHKNKRIQRGPSCINWSPSQTNVAMVETSPPTEETHLVYAPPRPSRSTQQQSRPVGYTYTEIHREQSSSFTSAAEDYVCPKCGTHAHIPHYSTRSATQSQSLPITQLRNTLSQTRSSGYYTLENADLTLPVYIGDEELMRINPTQEIADDPQLSMVTWCPGDDSELSGDGTPATAHDEVWVDSPGKLLETQVTGVTVPGTNKVISAPEAFYRGILRVVYWDYTKVDPPSGNLGVAIPLVDAVQSNAVKLASEPRRHKTGTDQGTAPLNAHVVWTTPEKHRSRYLVHAIRPDAEHERLGGRTTGDAYNVAAAIRAGHIDRNSGLLVVRPPLSSDIHSPGTQQFSYGTEHPSPYSEQTETVSVPEAIRRGILQVERLDTDSPFQTRSETQLRTLPLYSPPDIPQDMDI